MSAANVAFAAGMLLGTAFGFLVAAVLSAGDDGRDE